MEQVRPERCANVWKISVEQCRQCTGTMENKGKCPDYISHFHKTTMSKAAHEQPAHKHRHRGTF